MGLTKEDKTIAVLETKEVVANDPTLLKGKARNIEMFKDWFKGATLRQIGAKYGISFPRVHEIKKRDNWQKLATDLQERAYAAMSYEWKDFVGKVTIALKKDWERVSKRMLADETLMLTPDERAHGRAMLDNLIKATRLADDKPTEISDTSGTVTHRVLLPPGAKWGVIPAAGNVTHEEVGEKKIAKKLSIDDVGDVES